MKWHNGFNEIFIFHRIIIHFSAILYYFQSSSMNNPLIFHPDWLAHKKILNLFSNWVIKHCWILHYRTPTFIYILLKLTYKYELLQFVNWLQNWNNHRKLALTKFINFKHAAGITKNIDEKWMVGNGVSSLLDAEHGP